MSSDQLGIDPPVADGSCLSPGRRALACLGLAFYLVCMHPSAASAQVTEGPPRIRNVYIPTDQLKVLFGRLLFVHSYVGIY